MSINRINNVYEIIDSRKPNSNKGDYGRLVSVCGSKGMAGSAILCAKAALRCGVGLVECVLPDSIYPIVASNVHEAVYTIADVETDGLKLLDKATALVAGCGLGLDNPKIIYDILLNSKVPLVLDADALTIIAADPSFLKGAECPIIITPHPKEMSRLTNYSVSYIQDHRESVAYEFAQRYGVVVVLKGNQTVVASPEGNTFINPTGNPGMATGGSGDVLSGMIGSFVAQHKNSFAAACSGVYFHGLAGDIGAERLSMTSLSPSDLIDILPEIFRRIEQDR